MASEGTKLIRSGRVAALISKYETALHYTIQCEDAYKEGGEFLRAYAMRETARREMLETFIAELRGVID